MITTIMWNLIWQIEINNTVILRDTFKESIIEYSSDSARVALKGIVNPDIKCII